MATILSYVALAVLAIVVTFSIAMLALILYDDAIPWARKKKGRREAVPFTFVRERDACCYGGQGIYIFTTCPGCKRDVALKVQKECSMEALERGVFFGLECYHCDEIINIMVRKCDGQNR